MWRPRHGGHQLPTHSGARGRRGRHTVTLRCHYYSIGSNYLVFLKALIESFQNQVSLLDLEQVVRNAVDLKFSTARR